MTDVKALHIITGLGVGGAEQQLRLLLRHLPVDCDVVTLTNPGPVADGLLADGVHVVHLGMTGNRDLSALPRLARLIRTGGDHLVHTHLYRACLYGRLAARMAGVRAVVATEHSLGDSQMEGRPLTPGVRALYLAGQRLGSATVAVSPTVADRLRRWGVPAPRIEVVPNGIDLERFRFDPVLRLVPALVPLGGAISDYGDVLLDDERGPGRAETALAAGLAAAARTALVDLREVRPGAAAERVYARWRGPRHRLADSLCLELPALPVDELAARLPSAKARQRVRAQLRRLMRSASRPGPSCPTPPPRSPRPRRAPDAAWTGSVTAVRPCRPP
ncbi:hypothetical protein SVIOM342S_10554 [Streptomyces violaceorubidus]